MNLYVLRPCVSPADLKLHLQSTDYGSFLANEASPLTVSVIDDKLKEKMVVEFRHMRNQSYEPLASFMDFITYVKSFIVEIIFNCLICNILWICCYVALRLQILQIFWCLGVICFPKSIFYRRDSVRQLFPNIRMTWHSLNFEYVLRPAQTFLSQLWETHET